ncbi:MAG: M15 family metallopeptidase [Halieaceae bacterium]|nr:M15 family metallopeptidase [Halieaceae bacterium]
MALTLDPAQLTGRAETHLSTLPSGHQLQAEAADAFLALREDALAAGFDLAIASSFRSYARQLAIWNGKASGQRRVHDDAGREVPMARLCPRDQLRAILRYSAIPGTSRHHWGTDLDVYDAAALPAGYRLQLSPQEVAPGGMFDPLHQWLDQRMERGESHGFYRPYARDRGGVAPERWHLSYAPLAAACGQRLNVAMLLACWREECREEEEPLLLADEIRAELAQIMADYVVVPPGWCPAPQ